MVHSLFFIDRWIVISVAIIISMIVGQKLHPSTRTNSQNCSLDIVNNTLCVCEKTDKIWFTANGWLNITHDAHWSALLVQTKHSHHVCVTLHVRSHSQFIRLDRVKEHTIQVAIFNRFSWKLYGWCGSTHGRTLLFLEITSPIEPQIWRIMFPQTQFFWFKSDGIGFSEGKT